MQVELVDRIVDGKAHTKVASGIAMPNNQVCSQSDTFGPCHSPLAGKGVEQLIIRGLPNLNDELRIHEAYSEIDQVVYSGLRDLPSPVMVSVGHYIPSRKNSGLAPINAIESINESQKFLVELAKMEKPFSVLVVINDIKIDGNLRNEVYSGFRLPDNMKAAFEDIEKIINKELRIIAVSETKLVEKVNRDGKKFRKKYSSDHVSDAQFNAWAQLTGVNGGNTAKCIRGFARVAALPKELGHHSLLQIMPKCGAYNSHSGYVLGAKIYGEVPSYLIYRTHRCW